MRHTVFGWEEVAVENFAGVAAGEVARFGDWVEELERGGTVDGEIVDRFVGYGIIRDVGGRGEHGGDGSGVGGCEGFALGRARELVAPSTYM